MKKYAMYIGRWQNWHKGHEWLINQQLQKGKYVWVAIRDVPEDENNPKSAFKVMMDLMEEPFFQKNIDKILLSIIPDIESVNYGRGVGYDVRTKLNLVLFLYSFSYPLRNNLCSDIRL